MDDRRDDATLLQEWASRFPKNDIHVKVRLGYKDCG